MPLQIAAAYVGMLVPRFVSVPELASLIYISSGQQVCDKEDLDRWIESDKSMNKTEVL